MNLGDAVVLLALSAVIIPIIGKLIRDRKKGTGCCGDCSGCGGCK